MHKAFKAAEDTGCLPTVETTARMAGPTTPSSTPSPTVEEPVVV
ncbi:hypothetical protein [Streptomyces sp. NRRL S-37]|nr:hypothetical protein [Streptomyces sp. NRRL S-37]